ncbi:hypothetical protein [Brucella sp. 10RB9215]|uniref:hypothetical protein n=1 Tax=Brucella sp. 10RB9215 TaxID=1149953 RepID=UPI00155A9191|nr:hypothetical protein [Brucella sp. 10RB9215]
MNAKRRRFPSRSGGDERSQQFRLRSHDASLGVVNFDALCKRAQMIAAIAAVFQAYPLACLAGEGFEHVGGDGFWTLLIAVSVVVYRRSGDR